MNTSLNTLFAVGSGGFLGAILRFYVGVVVAKNFPSQIPIATLSVNIIGSFLIGILTTLFIVYTPFDELKTFLVTGFLGALTTYSTFALESYLLFNTSIILAITNIILNVAGTLLSVTLGYKLTLYILR
jgi:CrcB protein